MKKTAKKRPAPARRKRPVSRLADRRRQAPAGAGAVLAGPVSWTPPPYLPHQRVRLFEHFGRNTAGRMELGTSTYPDDMVPAYRRRIEELRAKGCRLIAVGHEAGMMVAHFATAPAAGNA